MGRRWIGVEMGEHAATHCVPRLRKVIEGEQGGVSEAVGWTGGGGFTFYRLGEPVYDETGALRPGIPFPRLAAHVWFSEVGGAREGEAVGPYLGNDGERGVALLYNGVLGDKRPNGGNVLTAATLRIVRDAAAGFVGPLTIYGEASRLGPERLRAERVTFKQTPYDVRTR
jgi:adenine-specific DNA-methyltransferase